MRAPIVLSGVVTAGLGVTLLMTPLGSVARSEQPCVSGSLTPEQQTRRGLAVQLARAINTAEARARTFVPIDGLTEIVIPDGLSVQMLGNSLQYTDRSSGYIFTIKDTRDACKLALFSDQNGLIYLAEPLR